MSEQETQLNLFQLELESQVFFDRLLFMKFSSLTDNGYEEIPALLEIVKTTSLNTQDSSLSKNGTLKSMSLSITMLLGLIAVLLITSIIILVFKSGMRKQTESSQNNTNEIFLLADDTL